MKRSIAILTMLLVSLTGLFGQLSEMTDYNVLETPFRLNGVKQNAYTLSIDADQKRAIDSWVSLMNENGGETFVIDTTQQLFLTEKVLLPVISDQSVDVFFLPRYEGDNDGSFMTFWFRLPDGSFLSSRDDPERFHAISKYLVDFGLKVKQDLRQEIHEEAVERANWEYPATGKKGKG